MYQDLDAYWMPFTANRQFKKSPRLLARAEGMHFWTPDGRQVLDGIAGLWCVNAGHARPKIVEAIRQQAGELDYAPPFQMGHPKAFELAERLVKLTPPGLNKVFYTNSGSESVETALKMAIAYHRVRGEGQRTRLIGRERGYHGVNFGGISVGGIVANRKMFGTLLAGVDHIRHTHDLQRNAFSRGQPEYGAEFADDLERVIALHDASTIAAVIVEPVAGSTGVLVPPKGYLQRLREICDKHGILLIFDEVITGFGRLGAPFAASHFGVTPDLMTVAKGITNGCVPMGAVFVKQEIHDAFMNGPEHLIEFFHGYTYSAHPLACAAALGTLDTYEEEQLLTRGQGELAEYFADAVHSLKGLPHVIDVRNIGLVGGIELEPLPGEPGKRAFSVFLDCWERGVLIRVTGDIIALSPPLIIEKSHIDQIVGTLADALKRAA
ncbi:aspartate aminotransferase family protein [Caldimonas thermodepolymerans]|jgi:beta-alanine--pyruvate transaminase|uniref:Beta-alanine--pyruvate transaminase n=1 Tax=Caldimonas thermodepolymerans TaxID=215580 RepID=A0AA46DHE8_9BURK|nr:aspartate aminotransferase family protein [Caldimonas thermodepolymerans]TCP09882.1 beta-alanine--pyruvate transaminase [Caldimonas thermodepolymerans]UZG45995.1 aspartate aminotransferase family protein [Caldimonas thermodepolymerans]UZG46275.1 aspartate aminotransferase family protein [Caldimonas thermodepolymerans]